MAASRALPPGFDDPVFQQLMGGQAGFSQPRELTVATAPLHLEILPLPKEGRPVSFTGAVGQFDVDAIVSNPRPSPGDPLNLIVKIGGKGNFKGMGPPVLTETNGWRSYPPGDKFDSTDDLSYAGVKSFDYTLIAQEPKSASPGCEFSYFDPVTAKYMTLATKPLPVTASPGSVAPAPSTSSSVPEPPSGAVTSSGSASSPAGDCPTRDICTCVTNATNSRSSSSTLSVRRSAHHTTPAPRVTNAARVRFSRTGHSGLVVRVEGIE